MMEGPLELGSLWAKLPDFMKTELRGKGLLIQDTDIDIVLMCDKDRRRKEKRDNIIASSNQWKGLEKICPRVYLGDAQRGYPLRQT